MHKRVHDVGAEDDEHQSEKDAADESNDFHGEALLDKIGQSFLKTIHCHIGLSFRHESTHKQKRHPGSRMAFLFCELQLPI
jgi:hypothetical protein